MTIKYARLQNIDGNDTVVEIIDVDPFTLFPTEYAATFIEFDYDIDPVQEYWTYADGIWVPPSTPPRTWKDGLNDAYSLILTQLEATDFGQMAAMIGDIFRKSYAGTATTAVRTWINNVITEGYTNYESPDFTTFNGGLIPYSYYDVMIESAP